MYEIYGPVVVIQNDRRDLTINFPPPTPPHALKIRQLTNGAYIQRNTWYTLRNKDKELFMKIIDDL